VPIRFLPNTRVVVVYVHEKIIFISESQEHLIRPFGTVSNVARTLPMLRSQTQMRLEQKSILGSDWGISGT
jgi:hypothetical protein